MNNDSKCAVTRPSIEFLGAAGTVTGSRFLIRVGARRVLVDAGLFQGARRLRRSNWEPFPVEPASIDAVLLTHAHIDHSGWLPGLVRDGFVGPIYATQETIELCHILLPDSAHIHEEQARFANERGVSKHHPALPLYTSDDAAATLPMLSPVAFGERLQVVDDLIATFVPAGHILGSASIHLDLGTTTVLVSGDLGRGDHPLLPGPARPLLPGPARPPAADIVLIESTYGDRQHGSVDDDEATMARTISDAAARGGQVVIPAFAVDRTELILLMLRRLMTDGRIPAIPVFADSPMALRVLDIYRNAMRRADPNVAYPGEVDFDPGGGLTACRTVEESMAINDHVGPAIIISASGMATGGRVLHHLRRTMPDPRNAVLLCGFQAAGTRGRSLADGERQIRMFGREIPVRCDVAQLHAMSVHADADDLVDWVRGLGATPSRVFAVHGEPDASAALVERLRGELSLVAEAPAQFDSVTI